MAAKTVWMGGPIRCRQRGGREAGARASQVVVAFVASRRERSSCISKLCRVAGKIRSAFSGLLSSLHTAIQPGRTKQRSLPRTRPYCLFQLCDAAVQLGDRNSLH